MTSPASILSSSPCMCGDAACQVPFGLCHCGCGKKTPVATKNRSSRHMRLGYPRLFMPLHIPRKYAPVNLDARPDGVAFGECWCGCGQKTSLAIRTRSSYGDVCGEPRRYVPGHREFIPNVVTFAIFEGREVAVLHSEGADVGLSFVMIDFDDLERVIRYRWNFWGRYARAKMRVGGGRSKIVSLHEFIGGRIEGKTLDHVNREEWDNRRLNLRPASKREQEGNKGLSTRNKTGFKGIRWKKNGWEVACAKEYLGRFKKDQKEDAARAYDAAARRHFGRFALLNFPD